MTEHSQAVALPDPESPLSLREQALGIARYVAFLPRGPRAVLRRLNADSSNVPPDAFWNIADRYSIKPDEEIFWMAILPLMVRHPHVPDMPAGRALAGAGVSAARIERWLRLDRAGALREAGRLLSQISDNGLNWSKFIRLLHDWDHSEYGSKGRREFARDFFLSREYRQRKTGDDS